MQKGKFVTVCSSLLMFRFAQSCPIKLELGSTLGTDTSVLHVFIHCCIIPSVSVHGVKPLWFRLISWLYKPSSQKPKVVRPDQMTLAKMYSGAAHQSRFVHGAVQRGLESRQLPLNGKHSTALISIMADQLRRHSAIPITVTTFRCKTAIRQTVCYLRIDAWQRNIHSRNVRHYRWDL